MLIRASGAISEDFFLLTLGATARYLLKTADGQAVLFDPGCSAHLPALLNRFGQLAVSPGQISTIFLTHLSADTVAGAAALKALNPRIQIIGAKSHRDSLAQCWAEIIAEDARLSALLPAAPESSLSGGTPQIIDRHLADGEGYSIPGGYTIRSLLAPGYTAESCCYLIEPLGFLVVDSGLGYFRGKNLPAPGADFSIEAAGRTLDAILQRTPTALCLPFHGALSGEIVTRHITALQRVLKDVVSESLRARREGISEQEIRSQISTVLYAEELPDPFLHRALSRSAESLWIQIKRQLTS